jgi:hypothetical protein
MPYSIIGKKIFSSQAEIESGNKKPALCFVGFDGFTDEIISVVNQSINNEYKTFIPTIKEFGQKILDASDKSCNFELVTKQTKIGGNAPIFTNALLEGGHDISFAGAIGILKEIEPLFQDMANRCKHVFPLTKSAKSDALEFQDGKIIFGKLKYLNEITYENLKKQIPLNSLIEILESTDLLVSANWTMLPFMTEIWKGILFDVAPKFPKRTTPRYLFIDLADPAKRTNEDLLEALETLKELNNYYNVILGLNISEAERICKIFKIDFLINSSEEMQQSLKFLFKALKITRILVHQAKFAILIDEEDYFYNTSFYTKKPEVTTGAGDNFNAGYCNALLHGLGKEETLILALATAGFYVRHGQSPTMEQLSHFLT